MKSKKAKLSKLPPEPVSAPAWRLRWWHVAAGALAATLAAFWVYGPALNGPFVFDDQALPFFSPHYAEQPLWLAIKGVRPFLMFTFWLNNRVAGTEPFLYHLFNLLLHLANSLLVFFIARRILGWAGLDGRRREWLSVFAGAVFLLHPVQTEAVSYVASRSENLSALFFYGAFAVFLYRRSPAVSWKTALAVLALYAAAASTKEHTVALPALLLLTDYFWNPGFSWQGIKRNWRLYALMAAAAAAGLVAVADLLKGSPSAGFGLRDLTWYQYFFTQWRSLWVYLRLFLLPYGQNVDYDFPISRTLFDHGAIIGLAGLLILLGCAIAFRKRYPLASYGMLAALILFAPTSSVVPILDPLAERRLYLPMIGLVLVAAELLRRLPLKRTVMAGTAAAVLAVLAFLCYQRNQVWASDVALWEDSVAKSPRNARARFQLGVSYFQQGRCDPAARQYEAAAGRGKPDYRLLMDWALADDCLNRPGPALEKLQQAAAIQETPDIYATMGLIQGKRGNSAEALTALEKALRLDPRFDAAYFYRGNVYAAAGDAAKAAADYRRAVEINPDNELARRGLARVTAAMRPR
jgi:tetratricopeptide (TPR) repeat protein